jgi:hypothetical protein
MKRREAPKNQQKGQKVSRYHPQAAQKVRKVSVGGPAQRSEITNA